MKTTGHIAVSRFGWFLIALAAGLNLPMSAPAQGPRVLPSNKLPNDARLKAPQTLDGYFPFTQVQSLDEWKVRAEHVRRRVLLAAGLWPLPTKTPLDAVIHGKVERDDFTVEKVFLQSVPGNFVTGNLYRPRNMPTDGRKLPGVLCPHGHFANGIVEDQGEKKSRMELSIGAERFESAARHPTQARCVQLARMGCVVFQYAMHGYGDSVQIAHRPSFPADDPQSKDPNSFFSVDADSRLQTLFGLQTWNSVRSLDFLLSLPEVDPQRIAVTGESGGGTQSMILSAIDDRVKASFPCVMVSTAMQGGCSCENAHYLRVGAGNIDIAALTAPRPLGMTAADDWTKELQTKGYPDLKRLYEMHGYPDRLTATFNVHFGHNYNHVSRSTMYGFMSRHFQLGFEEPVLERDFRPLSTPELTVWDDNHPRPAGDAVGITHERAVRKWMTADAESQLSQICAADHVNLISLRSTLGAAWNMMVGRGLPPAADIDFKQVDKQCKGTYVQVTGLVQNRPVGEELPTLFFFPLQWNGEAVLWVSPEGKSGVVDSAGHPIAAVQRLLKAQCAVVTADLYGLGEFTTDGNPQMENRMVVMGDGKQAWQHYAAYTYGYNPPLFAQRVRDLLTLVTFIRNHERQPRRISAVGLPGAGAWVAAARAIAGSAIDRAAIDTAGFRFASVKSQRHGDFMPGAVKYGDVPTLLALSAPHPLWLRGENAASAASVRAAYRSANAEDCLTTPEPNHGDATTAIVDWLIR